MTISKKLKLLNKIQLQNICKKLKVKYNKKNSKKDLIFFLIHPLVRKKYRMNLKEVRKMNLKDVRKMNLKDVREYIGDGDLEDYFLLFLQEKLSINHPVFRNIRNRRIRTLIQNLIRPPGDRINILYNGELGTNQEINQEIVDNLPGGILNNLDLSETDFSLLDLTNTDFRNSSLIGAQFEESILENTDFRGADLTDANMSRARQLNILYDEHTIFPYRYTMLNGILIGPGMNLINKDLRNIPLEEFKVALGNAFPYDDDDDDDLIFIDGRTQFPDGFIIADYAEYFLNLDDF